MMHAPHIVCVKCCIIYRENKCSRKKHIPTYCVLQLCEPIRDIYQDVIDDNWFSSIVLFHSMLETLTITMVGTMWRIKPEFHPAFISNKEVRQSYFAHHKTKILLVYYSKTTKVVCLLSTMRDGQVIDPNSGKP